MQDISAGSRNREKERGMDNRKTLKKDRQREQLILALLEHPGMEKAAKAAGISAVTAWRISKTPEFEREFRQAHRKCYSKAIGRLQQASGAAASILLKIMVDPQTPSATRVRAATRVLDMAIRAIEREDIEVRLSELERLVERAGASSN
jgi:hypothetical protein